MFFIGIFGIENKQKEIKILKNIYCKKCNENLSGKLIKIFNCFHFFFIPVFRWNEHFYFICNRCNSVYEIPKEKGNKIEKGESIDITYWDLNPIEIKYDSYEKINRCSNCGKILKDDFRYCPYCGTKLK